PFVLRSLYIAAGAPGTEPDCLKVPPPEGAAGASNVQQEMLAFPGADGLREGFVLGFLDCSKCQYEAISEQIDQGLRLSQQPQRFGQGPRKRDRQVVRASGYRLGG